MAHDREERMKFLKRGDEGHGENGLWATGVCVVEVGFFDGGVQRTELKSNINRLLYISCNVNVYPNLYIFRRIVYKTKYI